MNTSVVNDIEYWNILVVAVLKEIITSYIRVLKSWFKAYIFGHPI